MKLPTALLGIMLVSLSVTAVASSGVTAQSSSPSSGLSEALQDVLDNWRTEHAVVGVSLALTGPSVSTLELASGLADPEAGLALEPEHPMYVGSVTKTFVAAATLQLVQEGELSLDFAERLVPSLPSRRRHQHRPAAQHDERHLRLFPQFRGQRLLAPRVAGHLP